MFLVGIIEGEQDKAEGLSAAILWVLDFVEGEQFAGDTRPRYWAIRCLLDALVKFFSPPRSSNLDNLDNLLMDNPDPLSVGMLWYAVQDLCITDHIDQGSVSLQMHRPSN